jgi:Glycosyltransferase family 92
VKPYLSICASYRWEGPYLREWVAFHRVAGVERFFLYDNDSDDEHLEALAPYIDEGTVELRHWPVFPDGQSTAYTHCLEEHAGDSRWIAFVDLDEFLFSPQGRPLPEVLSRYERWPGVGVNRVTFGTSGHETRPAGLVVENYTRRQEIPGRKRSVKSIVDPRRAIRPLSPHTFEYTDGHPVDENEQPLEGHFAASASCAELRVNHYFTRSDEELVLKYTRPQPGGIMRRGRMFPGKGIRDDRRFGVPDHAIQRYLPALRTELDRIAASPA